MLEVLKNTTYRHLFLAQVIALIGTGLITIALALQAYDIAKETQPKFSVLHWQLR